MKDNKYAYITSASVSIPHIDVTSFIDNHRTYLMPSSNYELSINMVTSDSSIVDQFIKHEGNILNTLRLVDEEFLCLWCNSPNPIKHRHCSQCGAPRGFIIK